MSVFLDLNRQNLQFVGRVAVMAIILNLVLAPLISMAPKMSGKGIGRDQYNEVVSMMEHHNRTKLTSSLVVVLVVFLAMVLSPVVRYIPLLNMVL